MMKQSLAKVLLIMTALVLLPVQSQISHADEAAGSAVEEHECDWSGSGRQRFFPPRSGHCDCDGRKEDDSLVGVHDAGTHAKCVGRVIKSWVEVSGVNIIFKISPPDSSVTIIGAREWEAPANSPKRIIVENVETLSNPSKKFHRGPLGGIAIDRAYEIRDGKIEFHDSSPLRISITHAGYKIKILTIVPKTDPIEIEAKLKVKD